MDNEAKLTRLGSAKVPREKRKEARVADLRCVTPERRREIRRKTEETVAYLRASHEVQKQNGMNVTPEVLEANIATYLLTLECLDVIDNDIPI